MKNALSYKERDYKKSSLWKKVPEMKKNISSKKLSLAGDLFNIYESYRHKSIVSNRFTHAEMRQWLGSFEGNGLSHKAILGTSSEDREIALYTIGHGPVKIMLWSQMHGDEPTATMALMDMFNFFSLHEDHTITNTLFDKLSLFVIPMLNPDGAERNTRRTAQLIDVNRDALTLVTPEARILKGARDIYQPSYGFNLHDQDSRYTVGTTKKITAIALLAPAADEARKDTAVRLRAKRVASVFAEIMQQFIPGHCAKWDDTFYPTAFGDNIQKWGTSTVLIESGGWRGDPNKFFLRKLNCIGLLTTLYAIATEESEEADTSLYDQIPCNTKLGCDYIIRNATLRVSDHNVPVTVDIGINLERRFNRSSNQLDTFASIVEIGDLSGFCALEEDKDAQGALLDSERIQLEQPFSVAELEYLVKRA